MIRIIDISEHLLRAEIPGTLTALGKVSNKIEQMGFDIIIRETDHMSNPLRVYPGERADYHERHSGGNYIVADNILQDIVKNTCCKCGATGEVKQYSDNPNDSMIFHTLCYECHHLRREAEEECLYGKPIPYKALRDIEGNFVTDGDIILGLDAEQRPFWGLIRNKRSGWGGLDDPQNHYIQNVQWNNFSVLHGWGNFPSALSYTKHFIIIANCLGQNPVNEFIKDSERYLENWYLENEDFPYHIYETRLKHALHKLDSEPLSCSKFHASDIKEAQATPVAIPVTIHLSTDDLNIHSDCGEESHTLLESTSASHEGHHISTDREDEMVSSSLSQASARKHGIAYLWLQIKTLKYRFFK